MTTRRSKTRIGECIRLEDTSEHSVPADRLFGAAPVKDNTSYYARLSEQFISANNKILRDFGIDALITLQGSRVRINFKSGIVIGAAPLLSPTSGRYEYGIVTHPRFAWLGLGPVFTQTGWKVTPELLRLPFLPTSEREIPRWLLSGTVLLRLETLLRSLNRQFSFAEADLPSPRGQIKWERYALTKIPRLLMLDVPCRFPELERDRDLQGAIHFALRKQLASLETQRNAGTVVTALIELCRGLMVLVQHVPPHLPLGRQLRAWSRTRMSHEAFTNGVEAMEWTIENRGLAGMEDLRGLPWKMSMDSFYESWVETVLEIMCRRNGGILKTGRKRETIRPIAWDKPFLGSQKFLLPDFVIEHPNAFLVVDAKYKDHWEDLQVPWSKVEQEIREGHRQDLHQILSYSTLFDKRVITACLVYPCTDSTWSSLADRERLCHRASIQAGSRRIDLLLTTFPFSRPADEIAQKLGTQFFSFDTN